MLLPIGQTFSNSGDIDSQTGSVEEQENVGEVPEFKIVFQNPSYLLEKDEERDRYTCDPTKDECKVNMKLQTLDDKDISTKFICLIELPFSTSESSKCNPNTIVFPEGETQAVLKVIDKNNESNYKEKRIYIEKELSQVQEPEVESGNSQTGSIESASGQLLLPDPMIEVQSGLEYSGNENIWFCKNEECKVNLTAVSSFTGTFEEKDYECSWDFGGGIFTTANTDKKCNPGYVTYATGSFEIVLTIYPKDDKAHFSSTLLLVQNGGEGEVSEEDEKDEEDASSSSSGGQGVSPLNAIIVQSGLDILNHCQEDRCKVNLEYPNTTKERCEWNFGVADYSEKYLTTCNPGFIYFGPGKHQVGVKVFENEIFKGEMYLDIENRFLEIQRQNNIPPQAKITLQGTLGKKKFLSDENFVVCKEVERCSLNFTGEESSDPNENDILEYYWNFGNGEVSRKRNPVSLWYMPGKYNVFLKVVDRFGAAHEASFRIEVIAKPQKNNVPKKEKLENTVETKDIEYFEKLQIVSVLVNPKGRDNEGEYIEIQNTGISSINLKGISIDDEIDKGSRPFRFTQDLILGPFESRKFFAPETKIALNNTGDSAHLVYYEEILDTLTWDFSVPDDYVLTHENLEFLEFEVQVIRAVDGDTVVIEFEDGRIEKLRLVGVDTPETKHPKKEVEYFGKEASAFTQEMLEGKKVLLKQSLQNYRDKYNRLLGYIYIPPEKEQGSEDIKEEIFFNKLLIEKGYARAYLRFPFEYSLEFKKAENEAKKLGVGMWGHNEVRKEAFALAREEKKMEQEENKTYHGTLSFEDMKIYKIFGKIENTQNHIYHTIGEQVIKEYHSVTSLWSEEEASKRKKIVKEISKEKNKISFTKSVLKQKKALKIYGKTLPNVKVIVSGMPKDIELYTDNKGVYETKIYTGLQPGDYILSFQVETGSGEVFAIERTKELSLEKEYLDTMRGYYVPKISVSKRNLQNTKETPQASIYQHPKEGISGEKGVGGRGRFLVLIDILTGLIVFSLLVIILRREQIL